LVRDLLDRGVSPAAILAPKGSLLAEHHGAHGYAYEWGNVIEARTGSTLAWHFVPVMLWRDTEESRRAQTHTAARLIPELQQEVVAALRERLRRRLVLAGATRNRAERSRCSSASYSPRLTARRQLAAGSQKSFFSKPYPYFSRFFGYELVKYAEPTLRHRDRIVERAKFAVLPRICYQLRVMPR